MNTDKNKKSNSNGKNVTNNVTSQRQMQFYNNNRAASNVMQSSPSTFKRHLTSQSGIGDDTSSGNNKKQRQNHQEYDTEIHDIDERSNGQNEQSMQHDIILNFNQDDNELNQNHISKQAINYATDTHFPPIKIVCTPKVQKQNGAGFVQSLIKHIEKKFKNENPMCKNLLAFDAWWINTEGDMVLLTKCIEIFIYLCITTNYPNEINNIKIEPQLPKKLPSPCSVLIKFVHNNISIEDINQEIKEKYVSQYSCCEMLGSKTNRMRHIRVDFTDRNDYNTILTNGQISLFSQLYEVHEFLEAPKLLICSKCNSPGHMKKQCQLNFERCRRCSGDRKIGDHSECPIKCQHCQGEHISTSYKCPVLVDYQYELIKELKRHPERLPEHIQLFIPVRCRDRNDRSYIITNDSRNRQKGRVFNTNEQFWPQINPDAHSVVNNSITDELKATRGTFNKELNKINIKYEKQINTFKERWHLVAQQIKTQNEMINNISTTTLACIMPMGIELLKNTYEVIQTLSENEQNETTKNKLNNLAEQQRIHINKFSEHQQIFQQYQEKILLLMEKQTASLIEAFDSLTNINE
jgi:hypothetical protein